MKSVPLIALTLLITGCSLFQELANEVANGVVKYCEQPQDARQIVRDSINVELAPHGHVLHVHCKGDANGTP